MAAVPLARFFMRGVEWVAERDAMNSLSWEDSCLAASPGRSVTLHRRVNAGTPHESALDMAFRVSVCLGHEESGLDRIWTQEGNRALVLPQPIPEGFGDR